MIYDPHAIFDAVDANKTSYLVLGGAAMIFNYGYFIGAALAARRDKTFTFPLACTTFWLAHDLSFVLAFGRWNPIYNHWYIQGFWLGLIPTTLFEAWYIYQTWLYGKDELLPNNSRSIFTIYIFLATLAGLVGWWSFKAFLDDPIYAYTFGSSGFVAPFFVIPLVLKRGNAKGQSLVTWISYVCMQTCWFAGAVTLFGPAFRSPQYLAMATTSIGGGIVLVLLVRKYRCEKYVTRRTGGATLFQLPIE